PVADERLERPRRRRAERVLERRMGGSAAEHRDAVVLAGARVAVAAGDGDAHAAPRLAGAGGARGAVAARRAVGEEGAIDGALVVHREAQLDAVARDAALHRAGVAVVRARRSGRAHAAAVTDV